MHKKALHFWNICSALVGDIDFKIKNPGLPHQGKAGIF
jgi:hypothetical protein